MGANRAVSPSDKISIILNAPHPRPTAAAGYSTTPLRHPLRRLQPGRRRASPIACTVTLAVEFDPASPPVAVMDLQAQAAEAGPLATPYARPPNPRARTPERPLNPDLSAFFAAEHAWLMDAVTSNKANV